MPQLVIILFLFIINSKIYLIICYLFIFWNEERVNILYFNYIIYICKYNNTSYYDTEIQYYYLDSTYFVRLKKTKQRNYLIIIYWIKYVQFFLIHWPTNIFINIFSLNFSLFLMNEYMAVLSQV